MKRQIIIIFVILSGCSVNNKENVIGNKNHQKEEKCSGDTILLEKSGDIYCMKIDDGYYRIRIQGESLPEMPFGYELTEHNILKNIKIPFDSIKKTKYEKAINNDSIFTYFFGNSYIQIYKSEDSKHSPLEFEIKDKEIMLANGLTIGKSRDFFTSIYPVAIEFNTINRIGICDESEFSEIYFYFDNNVINKIGYMCYECYY